MTNTTKEQRKSEALQRMKYLKLHENVIREFEDDGILNLSEVGILFWLDPVQQKYVDEFEQKNNATVYHVIHDKTTFGELLTMLYVSDYPEEWQMDRDNLKQGYTVAYVENIDAPDCSEFGSVGVQPLFGGVLRTA